MGRDTIGPFEYQVLGAILQQVRDAYGVKLAERIKERTGREPSIGALYTTLERLEGKGMVTSKWGEATPERGGRKKRYYSLTGLGQTAIQQFEQRIGGFASDIATVGGVS